jgi:hypothetical protein
MTQILVYVYAMIMLIVSLQAMVDARRREEKRRKLASGQGIKILPAPPRPFSDDTYGTENGDSALPSYHFGKTINHPARISFPGFPRMMADECPDGVKLLQWLDPRSDLILTEDEEQELLHQMVRTRWHRFCVPEREEQVKG